MRRWILVRSYFSQFADIPTIGNLSEPFTLIGTKCLPREYIVIEPPWRSNKENISCIPEGSYVLSWREFPEHGRRLWLRDTSPRTDVMLHAGNFQDDTKGCLLPNLRFGIWHNQLRGYESQKALEEIESTVGPKEEIELVITHFHPI